MKHCRLTTLFLLVFVISSGYGVDFEGLLISGNEYYEQGEFSRAIQEYEKILKAQGTSAVLHYNLGNAYFNQKNYGQAILNFEKARILQPRDADIRHNLKFSKLFLKDRFDLPEPMPLVAWYNDLRQSLSLAELKLWESFWFALLVLGTILYRLLRASRGGRAILLATYVVAALFVLTSGWLWDRAAELGEKHAILLVKEAGVASAPLASSSILFVIHEGTSAEILSATDSWYEIRLVDGKTGWILHEAVGVY
ncbi:MAG: tetratricopeptide repeat protein [Candidatus Marinimicrobia bacterium]|nr:tetratricopeptide repeat protein [Candidatus Neomarinimicrobiota bacterium]